MSAKLLLVMGITTILTFGCSDFNRTSDSPKDVPAAKKVALIGIADFSGMQVTGVTISENERIFASFPRWRSGVSVSVVEIRPDGSYFPYPDPAWNYWAGEPREGSFTCVQAVFAFKDSLFVLDASNPMMKGVIGHPALYEFDLKSNKLKNSWKFDELVAPARSYLNDLRIDGARELAYISDSGLGAIVVLDLKTGEARRTLEESPSTKSEPMTLYTNGKPFLKSNGLPMRLHVDGLALFGDYLYYHSMTARHLYRIATDALATRTLTSTAISNLVEDLGVTPPPDGMVFDKAGNLYMADLEQNAIVYRTPGGEFRSLLRDRDLHWIDTLAITPTGDLVFTDSRIDTAPPGSSVTGLTFSIYKVALPK